MGLGYAAVGGACRRQAVAGGCRHCRVHPRQGRTRRGRRAGDVRSRVGRSIPPGPGQIGRDGSAPGNRVHRGNTHGRSDRPGHRVRRGSRCCGSDRHPGAQGESGSQGQAGRGCGGPNPTGQSACRPARRCDWAKDFRRPGSQPMRRDSAMYCDPFRPSPSRSRASPPRIVRIHSARRLSASPKIFMPARRAQTWSWA